MFNTLRQDIQAVFDRDPAARTVPEVILFYPGLHALWQHRLAHFLWTKRLFLIARGLSHLNRLLTGIDIHPGAKIGRNFFIDHGTGVVIGETSEIGDKVRIYQGVTLGGQSFSKGQISKLRGKKRHPTVEDGVTIYAGATILGGNTIIEKDAVVGGNVWITSSIPANTVVMIAPPKLSYKTRAK